MSAAKKEKPEIEKSTLPKLVAQANFITERLIEAGGELDPDLETALAVNGKDLAVKVDNYAVMMDRFSIEADYYKAKAKEFTAAAKSIEAAQARLKDNLKYALKELGVDSIVGNDFKFTLQKVTPKLILEERLLPKSFTIETVSYTPDKDKIRDALEAGLDVEGATLEQGYALKKYVAKGKK